jgi:hypothetical protein
MVPKHEGEEAVRSDSGILKKVDYDQAAGSRSGGSARFKRRPFLYHNGQVPHVSPVFGKDLRYSTIQQAKNISSGKSVCGGYSITCRCSHVAQGKKIIQTV